VCLSLPVGVSHFLSRYLYGKVSFSIDECFTSANVFIFYLPLKTL
jgi:hypothetical protein